MNERLSSRALRMAIAGVGGERADQLLVLGLERHHRAALVEGVQELEDPADVPGRVLDGDGQHRARRVLGGGVEALVERPGLVHADRVRVGDVDHLAGLRHVPGEARLAQPQGLGLEELSHLGLAEFLRDAVVLHDREPETIALAQEQRAGFGPREAPRRLEDPVQQRIEVALAGERQADLDELVEEPLAIGHRRGGHGAAARFRPSRLAS